MKGHVRSLIVPYSNIIFDSMFFLVSKETNHINSLFFHFRRELFKIGSRATVRNWARVEIGVRTYMGIYNYVDSGIMSTYIRVGNIVKILKFILIIARSINCHLEC